MTDNNAREVPYTDRELLAAMLLEHDAGGITLRTSGEVRARLASPADERLREAVEALEPFAQLAGPIKGEAGRPTYLEAISGPNGTDELELRTYVGDGTRCGIMDAADFRRAARVHALLTGASSHAD
jgi:hypothetical protein